MEVLLKYFPNLSPTQIDQFQRLKPLYESWNAKINVISRKDIDSFYERHVLHSLALGNVHPFKRGHRILDLGTGGGFPGIPLAILYPDTYFELVDSIRKKINVVEAVIAELELKNARATWSRVEDIDGKFEAVVTRAVAKTNHLLTWTKGKSKHLLALKGGDLLEELRSVRKKGKIKVHTLSDHYEEEFFETKVIVEMILRS